MKQLRVSKLQHPILHIAFNWLFLWFWMVDLYYSWKRWLKNHRKERVPASLQVLLPDTRLVFEQHIQLRAIKQTQQLLQVSPIAIQLSRTYLMEPRYKQKGKSGWCKLNLECTSLYLPCQVVVMKSSVFASGTLMAILDLWNQEK